MTIRVSIAGRRSKDPPLDRTKLAMLLRVGGLSQGEALQLVDSIDCGDTVRCTVGFSCPERAREALAAAGATVVDRP